MHKGFGSLESVVMESELMEEVKPIEPIIIKYEDKKNFGVDTDTGVRGKNKDIHHSIAEVGSGFIKHETLKNLIDEVIKKNKKENQEIRINNNQSKNKENKIHASIFLIDEPELLLHPFLISDISEKIANLEKENITTIITTHSPFLLHNFVQREKIVNLVIMQKMKDGNLKSPLYLWDFLLDNEIEKKIKSEYKEFVENKTEDINDSKFYMNKWKRLFNQETLRVFFAKKVLFVEGITDYLLFNNILKEKLEKELSGIEIIPIFGKFHYIFFRELAKWLDLDYWFLLDIDNIDILKHLNFWKKYGESKTLEKTNDMIHSRLEEGERISWACSNVEDFLGIKVDSNNKEYYLISKADTAIKNLESKNFAKLNELKKILGFASLK